MTTVLAHIPAEAWEVLWTVILAAAGWITARRAKRAADNSEATSNGWAAKVTAHLERHGAQLDEVSTLLGQHLIDHAGTPDPGRHRARRRPPHWRW